MTHLRTRQHPAVGIRLDASLREQLVDDLETLEKLLRNVQYNEGTFPLEYIDWGRALEKLDTTLRALRDGLEEVPQ